MKTTHVKIKNIGLKSIKSKKLIRSVKKVREKHTAEPIWQRVMLKIKNIMKKLASLTKHLPWKKATHIKNNAKKIQVKKRTVIKKIIPKTIQQKKLHTIRPKTKHIKKISLKSGSKTAKKL